MSRYRGVEVNPDTPTLRHLDTLLRRRMKVLAAVARERLDCLVVTSGANVRYLSGFTGSNGLVVLTPRRTYFFSDHRYDLQAHQEVPGAKIVIGTGDLFALLPQIPFLRTPKVKMGCESGHVTVRGWELLKKHLPQALPLPTENLVERVAAIKDAGEIAAIEQAAGIADRCFEKIVNFLRPGLAEREVAAELEYQMKQDGAEGAAFETIVASGPRSALPHGRASDRKIQKGDFVTLDFGAVVNGYASDLTRTVVMGRASSRQKKIYRIVLEAQKRVINAARAGIVAKDLDARARGYIAHWRLGKYFQHGLGHGLGLEVHQLPGINSRSTEKLLAGMVVTIEPGVYLPRWGGVRIEDDVLITHGGCRVLTQADRTLLEL